MKILVTGRLPEEILDLLRDKHHVEANLKDIPMKRREFLSAIEDKHGLLSMITDSIDREVFERAPQLRMIANCAVGFDNVDVEAATQAGVMVSNTPGVLTAATADLTLALILSICRRVVEGDKRTRAGEYRFWAPLVFLGTEVSGKTLGLIGMGRIGREVAVRARGFGMRILYHNRNRLEYAEEESLGVEYAEMDKMLSESDIISIHVPLTNETRHLIGEDELKKMKNSAFLINTSRGPVVDEAALVEGLKRGDIAGAGLDVYEREPELAPGLREMKNTVLLPHLGSATLETRTAMAMKAAKNLLAGLEEDIPPDCLNCEASNLKIDSRS